MPKTTIEALRAIAVAWPDSPGGKAALEAVRFIDLVAGFIPNGECGSCHKEGDRPNPECEEHEPCEVSVSDAVTTFQEVIATARQLGGKP